MPLTPGAKLGPYEVTAKLGQGGMGEVFRARDTRLGRDVALKVLPDGLAADTERRTRFAREARALAALNHPNIVTIYGVEELDGRHVIAMECVEGKPLSEIIAKQPLALSRMLAIAEKIAAAVGAAHRQGVVHRDLKPSNVLVGAQDRVKVLDFGLAKLRPEPDADGQTRLPESDVTGERHVVGTVAYMSPEQAEGRKVDERSDIFSLGVVLYELITGERPFKGDTSLSVLSAILRDTPAPVTSLAPTTPDALARLVRRCLEKDPDDRLQSALDLSSTLGDLREGLSSGSRPALAPVPAASHRRQWWWAVPAGALAVAAVAWSATRAQAPTPTAGLPQLTFARLTLLAGVAQEPMISPDGKWVVYVSNASGNQDIYLQSTTGQTPINLTKDSPSGDISPSFSPDGEFIAFRSERDGGGLFVMGRTGESVRRLTQSGFMPAWFPDGRRIVYASVAVPNAETRGGDSSELWTVEVAGGEPRRLLPGDAVQPRVSPGGRRIAYWGMATDGAGRFLNANRDLWTVSVDGSGATRLTADPATDWNPVWSPDGRWLYFLSNRAGTMNLWRLGIDEATGQATSPPEPLTAPAAYIRHFSLSADGRIGTFATLDASGNVARVPWDNRTATVTGPPEPLTTGPRDFEYMDVSPNGNELVLASRARGQEDLFLIGTDGTGLRNLTNDSERDRNPRWSPDGRTIVFYSDRSGANYDIWSINRDGSGLRQLTTTGNRYHPVVSPDGRRMSVTDITTWKMFFYTLASATNAPEALPDYPEELRGGGSGRPSGWSSSGRHLVGDTGFSTGRLTFLYDTVTREFRRLAAGGANPRFLAGDDRVLMAVQPGRLAVVDVTSGATREVFSIPGERVVWAAPSPDGRYLYFLRVAESGDVWTVRLGSAEEGAARTP